MVKFHYDWEFKDDGKTIEPISLGMVSDSGAELYMIHTPAVRAFQQREYFNSLDQTDLWLKDNVFSYINEDDLDEYGFDFFPRAGAQKVYDFITDNVDWSVDNKVELWGYFAAYDHVCLSQLFGRMIDLPPPMPMFTNELMTIRTGPTPSRPRELPEHHALYDAKYQKLIFEEWNNGKHD